MARNPKIKRAKSDGCAECGHAELDHLRRNGFRTRCQMYIGGAPNQCPCKLFKAPAKLI